MDEWSSRKRKKTMDEWALYLPEDIWKLIFSHLETDDLGHLFLVSKQFLSITNQLVFSLTVSGKTVDDSLFDRLLQRFQHLKSIIIPETCEIPFGSLLAKISRATLINLESLDLMSRDCLSSDCYLEPELPIYNLKEFYCFSPCELGNSDILPISAWFPKLEEIYINCTRNKMRMIRDDDIRVLASKLKALKSITLMGNGRHITDQSLIALALGCENLTEVCLGTNEISVTEHGIGFLMRHSPNLTSLELDFYYKGVLNNSHDHTIKNTTTYTFENSIAYASNLRKLVFTNPWARDENLVMLARANLQLKCLGIRERRGPCCTCEGLVQLLNACHSLRRLYLYVDHLKVKSMARIFPFLPNLTCLGISSNEINTFDFFTLTNSCPSLETISCNCIKIGMEDDIGLKLKKNPSVRMLSFNRCTFLNDDTMRMIGWVCPNLSSFIVSDCQRITSIGISEILNSCPFLRGLNIKGLEVWDDFMAGSGALKLKILTLRKPSIDDRHMKTIATRCPDLKSLRISYCQEVTNYGVMDIIIACKRLSSIDMKGCRKLSVDLLDRMLLERPMLTVTNPPGPPRN